VLTKEALFFTIVRSLLGGPAFDLAMGPSPKQYPSDPKPDLCLEDDIALQMRGTLGSTLKCKTRPGDPNLAKYDLPIPYFKSGTPEEFLKWKRNVEKGISGQGATDVPSKYMLTRRLLDGNTLTAFNLKAEEFDSETNPNFLDVIEDLTRHVFPIKAHQTQKRYMRHFL